MLSKSQARTFFLGGTLVTFMAFIGLTIYSFNPQADPNRHQSKIDSKVVRGKHLWEVNNCMGCHTIMGEGGYYAPELTKVYDRRGPDFIKAVLKTPIPWQPRGRKMVAYEMNDEDAEALVEYFKWIGELDLSGFERVVSPLSQDK